MPLFTSYRLVLTSLLLAVPWVQAQSTSASTVADSPLPYRSVFEHYRSYTEQDLVSWPEANDTVGRVGGWRAYAKEAAEPEKAAAEPAIGAKPVTSIRSGGKP